MSIDKKRRQNNLVELSVNRALRDVKGDKI